MPVTKLNFHTMRNFRSHNEDNNINVQYGKKIKYEET